MNSEIIAFAFGAKCGLRASRLSGRFSAGLLGSAASRRSRCSRCASAKAPMPKAELFRTSRRVGAMLSVHIEELVGGEELLTQVRQRHQLGVGLLRLAQS